MASVNLLSSKITREVALELALVEDKKAIFSSVNLSGNTKNEQAWKAFASNPSKYQENLLAYGLGIGLERSGDVMTSYLNANSNIESILLFSKNTRALEGISATNRFSGQEVSVNLNHYITNAEQFINAKNVDEEYLKSVIAKYKIKRPLFSQLQDSGINVSKKITVEDFKKYNTEFTGIDLVDMEGQKLAHEGRNLTLSAAEIMLDKEGLPYLCYPAVDVAGGYSGGCLVQDVRSGKWMSGMTDEISRIPLCGWYDEPRQTIDRLGAKFDLANNPKQAGFSRGLSQDKPELQGVQFKRR